MGRGEGSCSAHAAMRNADVASLQKPFVSGSLALDPRIGEHAILRGLKGSIAHGTYEPDKPLDIDVISIYVPDRRFYFSFESTNEKKVPSISEGVYDVSPFEARRAVRLLAKGDPNLLGLLYSDETHIDKKEASGNALIEHRDMFVTQHVVRALVGHVNANIKSMTNGVNYEDSERAAQNEKLGYDPKSASHALRLIRMAREVLESGQFITRRPDADELCDIKYARKLLDKKDFLEWLSAERDTIHAALESASLPETCDLNKAEELCISIIEAEHSRRNQS